MGAPWRRTNFWILPVAVFGSSVTKVTPCGALKWARWSRVNAISSAGVALVPLVLLTRRADVMGSLVNRPLTTAAAGCVAALIVVLNVYLLYLTFR